MQLVQLSRNKGTLLTWTFCLTALLSLATLGFAQGIVTGSIGGTVLDQSGAVVSGAKVTAISQETNQTFVTTTNEAGIFLLAKVPPGRYSLMFEKPTFARTEVRVEVV